MREIISGHRYGLKNLKSEGESILQFFQDSEIHGKGADGTSCQEVIRALIARVKSLHEEKPHSVNVVILQKLRECIFHFEMRALEKKVMTGFEIENIPIAPDGHLSLTLHDEREQTLLDALDFVHYYTDASDQEIQKYSILNRDVVLKAARSIREDVDPTDVRKNRTDEVGARIANYVKGT